MNDMPGWNPDSPASVTPFTLRRLMEYLQEHVDAGDIDPDTLVYAAVQPAWPFAYALVDLVADPPDPDDDWPGAVYLATGRCAGQLDPEIQSALGWAAEPPRQSDPSDPTTYTAYRDTEATNVRALPAPEERPTTNRSNRTNRKGQ